MKGFFLVLEGTDGSGKTEQFNRLIKKLRAAGYTPKAVDFPQYGQPSAYFVEQYLTGKYGTWKEVGPFKASFFYALDRFAAAQKIRKWLNQGKIVVANRYVASNLGHQGVKLADKKQRYNFFRWVEDLEYRILGIPKPDINFFLHMPADVAYKLIANKAKRKYLHGKKRDIHEGDISYLKQAEKIYLEVIKLFPKDYLLIECVPRGKLLAREEIAEQIWQVLKKLYPGF